MSLDCILCDLSADLVIFIHVDKKGDRACYMCGSPDLFIRDCPVSSNQYPMLQTGDAVYQGGMPAYGPPPYWNGLQFRPFPNVYATPGMMPYGSNMGPVNPYAVHSYMLACKHPRSNWC
ncbi:uncharacterized protein LOC113274450 isoform X2 [Papaver somniferum]|uniref:uncharacterized protein LOC113274450 isoform X2 n=1 Tax=Papaver somniferum TaxID=3469 RepID=UPI000E6FFE8C|nr:uncharacterized protein LOC113274450 isoform X2 [Papaver somniferum]